jgi:hypothetical protein
LWRILVNVKWENGVKNGVRHEVDEGGRKEGRRRRRVAGGDERKWMRNG